jgi:putative component of membrane protein insertase Oxa1/YidC/SpoIIIJ protein YidD
MKTPAVFIQVCLCAGGLMAGGVGEDSLVITAAIENPPGQTAAVAAPLRYKVSALGLVRNAYEKFLSSQDGSTCCFSNSCSNFCVTAVRDKGVIKGALLTADRLTRCNGIQPGRYEIDTLTGKNIDDIDGPAK